MKKGKEQVYDVHVIVPCGYHLPITATDAEDAIKKARTLLRDGNTPTLEADDWLDGTAKTEGAWPATTEKSFWGDIKGIADENDEALIDLNEG